ncbi:hypothetical protein KA977_01255 [Candidatus Dependentiae bacterium]|nr:hypothetical protein [Candidatus Dependentiae bacterium]
MVINPIDAQIMMLNQTIVGKEQQQSRDLPVNLMNSDIENLAKELKENEERVVKSNETEGQKINDENKEKSNRNPHNKKKKNNDMESDKKENEIKTDPVRGHIIDITL